jgi:hypothetical protein
MQCSATSWRHTLHYRFMSRISRALQACCLAADGVAIDAIHVMLCFLVQVGGVVLNDISEWETFCCGPVIEQLAIAQDLSGKSEFCLSSQVRSSTLYL